MKSVLLRLKSQLRTAKLFLASVVEEILPTVDVVSSYTGSHITHIVKNTSHTNAHTHTHTDAHTHTMKLSSPVRMVATDQAGFQVSG